MDNELDPVVGSWYRQTEKGQLFRVVAFDEDRGIVELQHFDGDLEEIDASDWFDMDIEPAEAPEDWAGPVDGAETDDSAYDKTAKPRPWKDSPDERESDEEEFEDEGPENDRDDWDEDDSDDDSDSEFDETDSDR
jgi:hypothetical protein